MQLLQALHSTLFQICLSLLKVIFVIVKQRWPRDTPLSTKVGTKFRRQVAGRTVGIVRSRTKGHGVFFKSNEKLDSH
jgi:hypothetical protein